MARKNRCRKYLKKMKVLSESQVSCHMSYHAYIATMTT
jgi:hypothetical protein